MSSRDMDVIIQELMATTGETPERMALITELVAAGALVRAKKHIDDDGVDGFAAAMKEKLAEKRAEGKHGWEDKIACPNGRLQRMLHEHAAKGDPVDVGNFAMMLWFREERTNTPIDEPVPANVPNALLTRLRALVKQNLEDFVEVPGMDLREEAKLLALGARALDEMLTAGAALPAPWALRIARLEKWVADLQDGMQINCVYCGHHYGPNSEVPASMADVLKEHVERCPEHPMSKLRGRLEEAYALIEKLARNMYGATPADRDTMFDEAKAFVTEV